MSDRAERLRELLARTAPPAADNQASQQHWSLAGLTGRLVEISASAGSAGLTAAVGLVLEAQREGEPVAWITPPAHGFYPPDVHDSGIDLEALVVVRAPDLRAAARSAEHLLRSGAFGLVVVDLVDVDGTTEEAPPPARRGAPRGRPLTEAMLGRLVTLAQKHDAAVVCLTHKRADAPSLGSMVSLRVEALREVIDPPRAYGSLTAHSSLRSSLEPRAHGSLTAHSSLRSSLEPSVAEGGYRFRVMALKDKRRGPSWEHAEVVRGPTGLR